MVREETINRLRRLKPRFHEMGIKRMAVFGSIARNQADEDSDVDILVDLDKDFGMIKFFQMKKEIESHVGRQVDIMTFDSVRAPHHKHILAEAVDV
ncbi:MAG: hypothetical protein DI586_09530 [Micavibrio aeruginosavorus]|uniref:Polymerase nucleotidyl transferase domain-containing protein n=1 Tax=Micavibrio aeruginosavorus TaxID=349221 RepID=A0A2W5H915_9BACT|nr:MAG: hypothetical protein DI586_09530 [Micavibrio aeruginosavorus]